MKHNIGDHVFCSGDFYCQFGDLCIIVSEAGENQTGSYKCVARGVEKDGNYVGGHSSFFSIEEVKENYPYLWEEKKHLIRGVKKEQCCDRYSSKFCPECGAKL